MPCLSLEQFHLCGTCVRRSSAMKQVESLRSQLNSVMEERDDALLKLADADETISSYSSSLANLQLVLEEFQDGNLIQSLTSFK